MAKEGDVVLLAGKGHETTQILKTTSKRLTTAPKPGASLAELDMTLSYSWPEWAELSGGQLEKKGTNVPPLAGVVD
jgi:hypothetical protein